MPFQKRGSLLAKLAVTGAALAAVAGLPAGAAATTGTGAGCNMPATSQVFSQFGDPGYYYLASGGAFEESLTWRTSGSPTLVSSTDSFSLYAQDKRSVRIPAGSSVQSGRFCVSIDFPHLRFVAKAVGAGDLQAQVDLYSASSGALISSTTTTIPAGEHANWAPTRNVSLNTSGMAPGENALAQVTLKSAGDWYANDVYIDPYAK